MPEKAAIGEQFDPFEGCVLNGAEAVQWAATMNDFSFEQAVDCPGQCIVVAVAVANAAHGRRDACRGQSLRAFDRQKLTAPVAVVNQPHALDRAAFMDGLYRGVDNDAGMRCGADPPAGNASAQASTTKAISTNPFRVATWVNPTQKACWVQARETDDSPCPRGMAAFHPGSSSCAACPE
ncbi:MAG: hypothetical protein P3W94_008225 [Paracoccus sp. (in: a-proteobacteria)]|nr:hypothetical protein [Paracoccus sp. (in: a-proteobacteria)]